MRSIAKFILFFIIVVYGTTTEAFAQDNSKYRLLNKFIKMHNSGTESAIANFVKETYLPEDYETINLDKHVAFYKHIIEEFGALNDEVYEHVEDSDTKLIVYLIKEKENIHNAHIDPTEVLSVEIDISEQFPNYLSRGIGLGALACTLRKDKK